MNIIFGFGEQDKTNARNYVSDLAARIDEFLKNEEWEQITCESINDFVKTFNGKTHINPRNQKEWMEVNSIFARVIKSGGMLVGNISHSFNCYNFNHPFSPDGMACLSIPFVMVFHAYSLEESPREVEVNYGF